MQLGALGIKLVEIPLFTSKIFTLVWAVPVPSKIIMHLSTIASLFVSVSMAVGSAVPVIQVIKRDNSAAPVSHCPPVKETYTVTKYKTTTETSTVTAPCSQKWWKMIWDWRTYLRRMRGLLAENRQKQFDEYYNTEKAMCRHFPQCIYPASFVIIPEIPPSLIGRIAPPCRRTISQAMSSRTQYPFPPCERPQLLFLEPRIQDLLLECAGLGISDECRQTPN
jgi:hypothetical protein